VKPIRHQAKAFAPASVANVAVGFDILGFSAAITGDSARVERIASKEVVVGDITGVLQSLPTDPLANTATAGLVRLIADRNLNHGFRVSIEKGIPMGSGLGGSAASAVAAIVAANELLEIPLSKSEMLSYALVGEFVASGSLHADNVAPSLYGGFTVATIENSLEKSALPEAQVLELPIPDNLWCILLHPHLEVATKMARGILKHEIPLKTHVQASANLATFMVALFNSDFGLLGKSLKDLVIEPQRAHLIQGFHAIQKAALEAGALGCTISGAGPTIFALAEGQHKASEIKTQMTSAAVTPTTSWAFQLKNDGARVLA
jgi:homoserine kinase